MGDVVDFTGITRLDIDPERIRQNIPEGMQGLVVMGYDSEGEFYFASSYADGAQAVYLAECMKHMLMRIQFGDEEL